MLTVAVSSDAGEVSSTIAVDTVDVPRTTFSTPPPIGLLITTLYVSLPSAYASSFVSTLNVTLVEPAGIVTVVFTSTKSPVSVSTCTVTMSTLKSVATGLSAVTVYDACVLSSTVASPLNVKVTVSSADGVASSVIVPIPVPSAISAFEL